jgi:beta-galactosidase/beta-glucuronidase
MAAIHVFLSFLLMLVSAGSQAWQPAQGPLHTRWTVDVTPAKVHPEYPRPQFTRKEWLNLNGLWDYSIRPRSERQPSDFDGRILVPFPVESALSGVMKHAGPENRLWYRRLFQLPPEWAQKRILLHFGAIDWEAMIWINGQLAGEHHGGYNSFTLDITSALRGAGNQEMVVAAWDPSDAGYQPRGKQVRNPHGIWYTPTTGIWQTVWLEAVPLTAIDGVRMHPDIDSGTLTVQIGTRGAAEECTFRVTAVDSGRIVAQASGRPDRPLALKIKDARLWSPDAPFLYGLELELVRGNSTLDRAGSYFAMRKISLGKDASGGWRLFLNNSQLFHFGPLDQGFWPDGIYTAPTDEALRYDIEVARRLGFNMARKHVKVEPDRWYYWCDKLGLMVWQDMPSGDRFIGKEDADIQRVAQSSRQFELELKRTIDQLYNHPCIVMWVPFNEGWGQYDTARLTDWIKSYDPTRLVDSASGWSDRGTGHVLDIHSYPGPAAPQNDERRAAVLGEFGGLGLPLSGHTWQAEKNWGYKSFQTREELTGAYVGLIDILIPLIEKGLAAAVFTQTTDVEIEVNGLMTYDREMIKMDADRVAEANRRVHMRHP